MPGSIDRRPRRPVPATPAINIRHCGRRSLVVENKPAATWASFCQALPGLSKSMSLCAVEGCASRAQLPAERVPDLANHREPSIGVGALIEILIGSNRGQQQQNRRPAKFAHFEIPSGLRNAPNNQLCRAAAWFLPPSSSQFGSCRTIASDLADPAIPVDEPTSSLCTFCVCADCAAREYNLARAD